MFSESFTYSYLENSMIDLQIITSAFGLLNLFKPGGGAGADSAGQLLGGALPGGLGGIQDIGGGLTGILGNLSPKSSKAS